VTSTKWRTGSGWRVRVCLLTLACGIILWGLGCSVSLAAVVPSSRAVEKSVPPIDYSDLDTFDRSLSGALRGRASNVTVQFVVPTTVNEIPARMDKWLSMVEKYGGQVKAAPDPDIPATSRGMISDVISLVVGAYNLAREKILYGPSENYNATVYYERGSGRITRVVFSKKN